MSAVGDSDIEGETEFGRGSPKQTRERANEEPAQDGASKGSHAGESNGDASKDDVEFATAASLMSNDDAILVSGP